MDGFRLTTVGPLLAFGPLLLCFVLVGPLLIYPLARWRLARGLDDPHLGIKVALGYFGMLAFQLALLGMTSIVFALLSKAPSEDRGDIYRLGFGFLLPGLILWAAHVVMLTRTNQEQFPAVRRLFLGYNLVLTGLFGLVAFVMACQALFSRGSSGDFGRLGTAALLVYGSAWCACGVRFGRIVFGAAPVVPHEVVMQPAPVQQSGPTLPALGGGAFPPIDPNPKS